MPAEGGRDGLALESWWRVAPVKAGAGKKQGERLAAEGWQRGWHLEMEVRVEDGRKGFHRGCHERIIWRHFDRQLEGAATVGGVWGALDHCFPPVLIGW